MVDKSTMMLSERLKFIINSMGRTVLIITFLTSVLGCALAESDCTDRRCLAEMLIKKGHLSQPQGEDCILPIYVPFIEYQTLGVDTKRLRLFSRLQADISWTDPALAWDTLDYPYYEVILPVDKVWTPELHVTNGIVTTMKHSSNDLLVYYNGTVEHSVVINAEVNCEVNLFNYPFAADECPVAIQTYSAGVCGTELYLGWLKTVDGSQGDWKTDFAEFRNQGDGRDFIMVGLSIKQTSPFITLMLPTILIVLADLVSFALPLGGGERNAFKVTLVLSFTLFLNILNEELPGDSECGPVIRIHFCICLILLVVSMLVSMVLTRVAQDGMFSIQKYNIWRHCVSKVFAPKNTENKTEKADEETKVDISVIQLNASEDTQMLRHVVTFLEAFDAKEVESEKRQKLADKMDKIFFCIYFIIGGSYFATMIWVMVKYNCEVNHFDFWYDESIYGSYDFLY